MTTQISIIAPTFVSPSPKPELNGEIGLTLSEIATSLGVQHTHAKDKLERMIKDNRIKGCHAYTFLHKNNGLHVNSFVLTVRDAKFFVAKYDNDIGDGYTNFLLDLEDSFQTVRKTVVEKKEEDTKLLELDTRIHKAKIDRIKFQSEILGLTGDQAKHYISTMVFKETGIEILTKETNQLVPLIVEKRSKSLTEWLKDTGLTARKANQFLKEKGYIASDIGKNRWKFTPKGSQIGELKRTKDERGKDFVSIHFYESVLDVLKDLIK